MSVVKAKIQAVEDMYRLIWTTIANQRPASAIYSLRWPGIPFGRDLSILELSRRPNNRLQKLTRTAICNCRGSRAAVTAPNCGLVCWPVAGLNNAVVLMVENCV